MGGTGRVTRKKIEGLTLITNKTGGTVVSEKKDITPVKTVDTTDDMATVGVSMSHTMGLPNYSSVKVQVSLYMPCLPNMGVVDSTYAEICQWVDARMETLIGELEKDF